jgi:type II secretory pathway pseudopilin PulG
MQKNIVKNKNERGITLIALVITIIVLIILAGIGIGASTGMKGNIQNTTTNLAKEELAEVQQAVLEIDIKYNQTKNINSIIGNVITYSEAQTYLSKIGMSLKAEEYSDTSDTSDKEKYYYILKPSDLENIGLKNSEDTYMVNYSTGEVFNVTKQKTADGELLYTFIED